MKTKHCLGKLKHHLYELQNGGVETYDPSHNHLHKNCMKTCWLPWRLDWNLGFSTSIFLLRCSGKIVRNPWPRFSGRRINRKRPSIGGSDVLLWDRWTPGLQVGSPRYLLKQRHKNLRKPSKQRSKNRSQLRPPNQHVWCLEWAEWAWGRRRSGVFKRKKPAHDSYASTVTAYTDGKPLFVSLTVTSRSCCCSCSFWPAQRSNLR